MPSVLTVTPSGTHTFELQLAGSGPATDLVAVGILKPLNAKLGQACFNPGASAGDEVGVTFDAKCNDPAILGRLETNPPAALYSAPAEWQRAVVKNPETLKKLKRVDWTGGANQAWEAVGSWPGNCQRVCPEAGSSNCLGSRTRVALMPPRTRMALTPGLSARVMWRPSAWL